MKKNGLTLIELIVSIALIGVALVFLFRLLVMLRYDENYSNLNAQMIVNNSEIIKNIETDFINKGLKSFSCSAGVLKVTFNFKDGSSSDLEFRNSNQDIIYNKEGRRLPDEYYFGRFSCAISSTGPNNLYVFKIPVLDKENVEVEDKYQVRFIYSALNSSVTESGCDCQQIEDLP